MVDGAGENALARLLDDAAGIGRAVAVSGAGHESLDARDIAAGHAVELGEFEHPHPGQLHRGILRAEIGDFIGEPGLRQGLESTRFAEPLSAFED